MVLMRYKKLDVWQLARELVIEIHHMTIKKLNTFVQAIESSHISER
jgi:hypothetical protein